LYKWKTDDPLCFTGMFKCSALGASLLRRLTINMIIRTGSLGEREMLWEQKVSQTFARVFKGW